MSVELVSGALLGAGRHDHGSRLLLGGRQESNPHSQLGRLQPYSGHPLVFTMLTRGYGTLCFAVSPPWVEKR